MCVCVCKREREIVVVVLVVVVVVVAAWSLRANISSEILHYGMMSDLTVNLLKAPAFLTSFTLMLEFCLCLAAVLI